MERLNIKLCKYLLGVHKKSTNNAVRGELGRYPILINVLTHATNYYKRISSADSDSLLVLSCTDNETCSYEKSWISIIRRLCTMFNLDNMKTDMSQLYKDKWENLMRAFSTDKDSKLRSYVKFKKNFCIENYILQFPLNLRKNLTKLRISAHNLAIETGRFTKPKKTPIEKRICFNCNIIEDEFHFIFGCEMYETERSNLLKYLQNISTLNFNPSEEAYITIMSCLNGDVEVGRAVCNYVNTSLTVRTQALSEKKEKDIHLRPLITITKSGRHSVRPDRLDL